MSFEGYPTPYDPLTDFSAEAEFEKDALDPELDAIATFTAHVTEIIQAVLRDDWQLQDGLVTYEALSQQVKDLITGGNGWTGQGPFVSTLEGLTGSIDLDADNGITIEVDGQTIIIHGPPESGVTSFNGEEGDIVLQLTANTGLTLGQAGTTFTLAGDLASQAEAEAGALNTKLMTPLRTAQSIAAALVGYAQLGEIQEWTAAQYVAPFEVPWSATPQVDFDQSNNFFITLEGDTELDATQLHDGQEGHIVIIQDAVGGHALTFTAFFRNAEAPVEINEQADAITVLDYYTHNGQVYLKGAANTGEMKVLGARCQNNAVTPNTKFDLQADSIVLRGTRNTIKTFHDSGAAITCDIAAGQGINKRDQVANFDPDTDVHFYWITDGATLATIASLTAPPDGPALPVGYTHWAYAGTIRHNGASQLVKSYIRGSRVTLAARQDTAIAEGAADYTAVDLSDWVPEIALMVKVQARAYVRTRDDLLTSSLLKLSIDGVNEFVRCFAESGSTVGTNESDLSDNDSLTVEMPCPDQQIYYGHTEDEDGSDADAHAFLYVLGYTVPNGGE